jgi:hypothetical protein
MSAKANKVRPITTKPTDRVDVKSINRGLFGPSSFAFARGMLVPKRESEFP